MSIVLYALGVGLIGWSLYLVLSADSFAALDIAASLAGWGAFTVGLGAVAAALARLTKAVERSGIRRPIFAKPRPRAEEPWRERLDPQVLETAMEAALAPAELEPTVAARPPVEPTAWMDPEPQAEPEPMPAIVRRPKPLAPAPAEPAARVVAAPPPSDDAEERLGKKERRQRRREAKLREEEGAAVADRPKMAARGAGGDGELFAGPRFDAGADRPRFALPGPVAPPALRASRPIISARETRPAPDSDPAGGDPKVRVEARPSASVADKPVAIVPEPPAHEPIVEAPVEVPREVPPPRVAEAAEPEPALAEPKVPDWLARARARRAARAPDEPAVSEPTFVAVAPEPELEPETASNFSEPAPDPVEDVAPADGPRLVSEGEHRGVTYRFFDDGSVEALSPHGVRRFTTVEELRATVIAARGADYEPEPEAEPAVPEPVEDARAPETDPLELALSELEDDRRWDDGASIRRA